MKQTLRQRGIAERGARLVMGGLVLALGCGGSDSGKGRGTDDRADGGGDGAGNGSGNGSSSGEGGMSGPDQGADGSAQDESCGGSPFGAEPVKVSILVVLDKSKSMDGTPSGFTTSKWDATKASLSTALGAVQNELAFGLQFFPTGDNCTMPAAADSTLTVPVAAGGEAFPGVVAALSTSAPLGGTPTAAALKRALSYFTTGLGAGLEGERYILLATDGGPNCNSALTCGASSCVVNMEPMRCESSPVACCASNCCDGTVPGLSALNCLDDADTLRQVQALRTAGISTFVVGIPGSEAFASSLDAFALAGGVPNAAGPRSYFAVDAPDALTSVLSAITKSLVKSCRLQLESVPPALDQLNVKVEDEIIPRGAADGWDLDESTTPPTVIIKGASCTRIESQGVKSVEVVYGCPTVTVL